MTDANRVRGAIFCPFCTKLSEIRRTTGLRWCPGCRMTWLVSCCRQLRKAPTKKRPPEKRDEEDED